MKDAIALGKTLTKNEMKSIFGATGLFDETCGSVTCSRYQSCCSQTNTSGETVYYCTTTACL